MSTYEFGPFQLHVEQAAQDVPVHGSADPIETVPCRGYRFTAPVRRLGDVPQPPAMSRLKSALTSRIAVIAGAALVVASFVLVVTSGFSHHTAAPAALSGNGAQAIERADMKVATAELQRAISLDPSYGPAQEWYGIALLMLGRLSQGVDHLQIAARHSRSSRATCLRASSCKRSRPYGSRSGGSSAR
ncbi:MAG: hypothetical protein ACXVAR_07040 [Vulcanimicrobiaceae bacterium]